MHKLQTAKTKIVIVGLGGVGGYYGGLLSRYAENQPDISVVFFARGAHLKAIQSHGLKVSDENQSFITHPTLATDDVHAIGQADYVIIATKSYGLQEVLQQIKPIIADHTVILPLLNGVDITDRIRAVYPQNEVWYGCVYIITRITDPGVIEDTGNVHFMHFGHEKKTSERLQFMENLFQQAGIEAYLKEDARRAVWRKFFFISTTAALTTYYNTDFTSLIHDADKRPAYLAIMQELYAISIAEQAGLKEGLVEELMDYGASLPAGKTSSMNSDYLAGNPIELETLVKVVIDLGIKHNISTPVYEQVYEALKGGDN